LQPTEVPGIQIGAVRYKAWDVPSSLYSDLPAVSPLIFESWIPPNNAPWGVAPGTPATLAAAVLNSCR